MKKKRTGSEKSGKNNVDDKKLTDLNRQRIKKNVLDQTDENHHKEVDDFLKRYRDDTLTGL